MDVAPLAPVTDRPFAAGVSPASRTMAEPAAFDRVMAGAVAPAVASAATLPQDTPWVDGGDCSCGVGDGAARLGPDGAPREYLVFGAGRLPASSLEPVGGAGVALWPPAASSLRALGDAAAAEGLRIEAVAGYRPGDPPAAWGTRVDLRHDEAGRAWLATHAASFGFLSAGNGAWTYRPTH